MGKYVAGEFGSTPVDIASVNTNSFVTIYLPRELLFALCPCIYL
jgi:hypothetical protein